MLRWVLKNGNVWQQMVDAGIDPPEELHPPEILPGFNEWYQDFWDLSTERQIGMGIGPIPASAIDRHVMGWVHDDAYMFREIIRSMDAIYMSHAAGKIEPDQTISAKDAFRAATSSRRG